MINNPIISKLIKENFELRKKIKILEKELETMQDLLTIADFIDEQESEGE